MDVIDGEWVLRRMHDVRGERAKLAEYVGISRDKLSKVLKGERQIQPTEAPLFVAYFENRDDAGGKFVKRVYRDDDHSPGDTLITVYDVAASAGPGMLVENEDLAAYSLAFPPNYLEKLTRSNPNNLAIISIKGESMAPTLHDDDIVLLDTSKRSLDYDGLFVLRFGDTLHVKRVTRSPRRGYIKIISDNSAFYPAEDWPEKEVWVVGKVIWKGGKV
jgi:phage repressor protein C with HTH and peptisase S24 domain